MRLLVEEVETQVIFKSALESLNHPAFLSECLLWSWG